MNNIYSILSFVLIFISLTSCKTDNKESIRNQENNSFKIENIDLDHFKELDLRPYEINASFMVPKEETTTVKHQLDSFDWIVKQGKQSYVTIADWGTENGLNHLIEEIKNQTKGIEIIEKSDDFILYKKTVGTSQMTYHAAAQYNIEGINYLFTTANQGFSEEDIKTIVASLKSVEVK